MSKSKSLHKIAGYLGNLVLGHTFVYFPPELEPLLVECPVWKDSPHNILLNKVRRCVAQKIKSPNITAFSMHEVKEIILSLIYSNLSTTYL